MKSNNGDLGQFKKYLTHELGVDLSSIDQKYGFLLFHKIVRNAFAHSNGEVDSSKLNKVKNLSGLKFINFHSTSEIYIDSRTYLDDIVLTMDEILNELIDLVDIHIGRKKLSEKH